VFFRPRAVLLEYQADEPSSTVTSTPPREVRRERRDKKADPQTPPRQHHPGPVSADRPFGPNAPLRRAA
jgi:hypothetical protein